jgi:hypothetical protein
MSVALESGTCVLPANNEAAVESTSGLLRPKVLRQRDLGICWQSPSTMRSWPQIAALRTVLLLSPVHSSR